MPASVSRRNLAKGAAWAAPAVLATSAIPAYAASTSPYGSICSLFFGNGNVNSQTTSIYLNVVSSSGMIYAGQTVTWTFNASSATVPGVNYPSDGSWTLTTSPAKGTRASTFTVTLTANQDISVDRVNCQARLIWDGSASAGSSNITPKSTVTVASSSDLGSYSSKITIPQRWGKNVNDSRRTPLRIEGQCYPTIQWVNLGNSTNYNKDTVLYFNGNGPILPDSNAGNNQKITSGTC